MARALFNDGVEKALDTLNRQFHFVSVAVDSSLDDNGSDQDFSREVWSELSSASGTKMPNKMNEAIATQVIEDTLVPVLRLEK